MAHFFREERLICERHGVEAVWQVAGHVMVPGQLYAAVGVGDPRSASFVDFWKLGAGDSVAERRTFLVTGHAFVDRQPAMIARREPRIVAQTTQLSHKLTSKTAVY